MLDLGRRQFITLLGGTAAAWPLAARAQQPKVYRIGLLETVPVTLNAANYNALRQGLRELGYVEGQNLVIDYRSADGHAGRFPDLATELVRRNVDLMITRGTPAALAAKNATATIPVVMTASGDPVGTHLVASLARPGGNLTGLSAVVRDLYGKRVEMLKEMMPAAAVIAGFFNLINPVSPLEWKEAETATQSLGLRPLLFDVRNVDDIQRAFDAASRERNMALVIGLDTVTQEHRKTITELAAKHRLPAIYAAREFIDAGGLALYGVSYPDLYRRAATYVDRIFKGAKPADLPVEQPTRFELVINLKTAKALGLEVPPTLLARADEVIE
jgi:putative tryptophan/tyrosine transport system substrate-binding protein